MATAFGDQQPCLPTPYGISSSEQGLPRCEFNSFGFGQLQLSTHVCPRSPYVRSATSKEELEAPGSVDLADFGQIVVKLFVPCLELRLRGVLLLLNSREAIMLPLCERIRAICVEQPGSKLFECSCHFFCVVYVSGRASEVHEALLPH